MQRLVEPSPVGRGSQPIHPVVVGLVQQRMRIVDADRGRDRPWTRIVQQNGGAMTGHDEARHHGSTIDERERRPNRILEEYAGILAISDHHSRSQLAQAGHFPAVIKAWLEGEFPFSPAGQRLQHPNQPERFRRPELLTPQRDGHEVDNPHAGMLEGPDGLKHIGIAPVLPEYAGACMRRCELQKSAPVPVQQPAEHPWAVEARQAHPVDRALLADQRGRAQIANHAVIADGRITNAVLAQSVASVQGYSRGSRNTARPTPKPMRPSTPTTTSGTPTWIATSVTLKRIPIRVTHPLHPSPRVIRLRTAIHQSRNVAHRSDARGSTRL